MPIETIHQIVEFLPIHTRLLIDQRSNIKVKSEPLYMLARIKHRVKAILRYIFFGFSSRYFDWKVFRDNN